ncbi:WAT1-related protein At3g02690, chloroplastic isoform X2 [Telopea speciosissima]|uniref:WAT1-related protein At3g02690, chloroplastic isoform X2 n=1 Tax=Telopea speciosissima TaxID=54955 RepID=UPI001CC5C3F8|nr:WAT1-related protein At3g02690, chloroplastic isoform X2 [Telopea speciosissima]
MTAAVPLVSLPTSCIPPSNLHLFWSSNTNSVNPRNRHGPSSEKLLLISSFNPNELNKFRFRARRRVPRTTVTVACRRPESELDSLVDCVGTGLDVECDVSVRPESSSETVPLLQPKSSAFPLRDAKISDQGFARDLLDWAILISPFFFWGTAMVAMKEVLPKAGPFFVSSFRLIPAGMILIGFAGLTGRRQPSGVTAWASILLFGIVDAACFQGFLAEGLQKTSAGLGSVIIDSQPLTVAILAALLFGESIGFVGAAGLVFGVIGLLLLEHMVIGGLPLVALSVLNHEPAINGSLKELTSNDLLALVYTSFFGSAVSYGVFFYNATRGSLTKLSSLTFLTPMFASIFGFLYLGETFSPLQLVGAFVTVVAIYMVNYQNEEE